MVLDKLRYNNYLTRDRQFTINFSNIGGDKYLKSYVPSIIITAISCHVRSRLPFTSDLVMLADILVRVLHYPAVASGLGLVG